MDRLKEQEKVNAIKQALLDALRGAGLTPSRMEVSKDLQFIGSTTRDVVTLISSDGSTMDIHMTDTSGEIGIFVKYDN